MYCLYVCVWGIYEFSGNVYRLFLVNKYSIFVSVFLYLVYLSFNFIFQEISLNFLNIFESD